MTYFPSYSEDYDPVFFVKPKEEIDEVPSERDSSRLTG